MAPTLASGLRFLFVSVTMVAALASLAAAVPAETIKADKLFGELPDVNRAVPATAAVAAEMGTGKTDLATVTRDRGAFVQSTLAKVRYGRLPNGKVVNDVYNVIIFNMGIPHTPSLAGVYSFSDEMYEGVRYGIWVFRDGTFVNHGDGGWINWGFSGRFTRSGPGGKVVRFRAA